MCGIAGYLDKTTDMAPVGRTLLRMLDALGQRGPDSAGLALFRGAHNEGRGGAQRTDTGREVCWVKLPDHADREDAAVDALKLIGSLAKVKGHQLVQTGETHPHASSLDGMGRGGGSLLRVELERTVSPAEFCSRVENRKSGLEIISLGARLELAKQVGAPGNLTQIFDAHGFTGSHGIGHTRLSTESKVDLSHSQPFWARGVPDLATVHNGHITNYHRLRHIYEQQGIRFFTENDSEVIGVYLADQLRRGCSLEQAMAKSLVDLDGSFTYLVATPEFFGYARDPFAMKPLIVVETDRYVAVANEEIALRSALGSSGVAVEPSGNVYRLWRTTGALAGVG